MTQVVFGMSAFINFRHAGAVQYGITILCGLMMFLDGSDTQATSYMALLIAKEWGLSGQLLGPIFSSALTGLIVALSTSVAAVRLVRASTSYHHQHGRVCISDIDHRLGMLEGHRLPTR